MKKCFLFGIGALTATSLLVSCSDELGGPIANGNGRILPNILLDTETVTSRSTEPSSRANGTAKEIVASDLTLRLTNSEGQSWQWPYDEFPADRDFSIGTYTLEAYYGDPTVQGFDLPAYHGSQTIVVKDGETTTPSITATLANAMVSLKYKDAFVGYMADYGATVNGVEYTKDEVQPVYVTPGEAEIKLNVTKPNGLHAEFTLDPVTVEARHHYTITIDVNNGNTGDAVLNVTFDDMMETETVDIDLSDKLLSTPAPEITPKGFEYGQPIDILAGTMPDNQLSMSLVALAGLKEVNVTTTSTALISQGWPEKLDLMAADVYTQEKLTLLGLDVLGLWKTPGQMAVLDFTNVPLHFAGTEEVTFTVTVKDQLLRECEAATLKFNVEKAALELVSADKFFQAGTPLNIVVGFNGGQSVVKENIKIQYKNPISGMWNDLTTTAVSEGRSRAMLDYTVTVTAPDTESAVSIRAKYQETVSNELSVEPYVVTANENDIYASFAYIRVIGVNGGTQVTINTTKDGESPVGQTATLENNYIKISGLEADTHYTVEVIPEGMNAKNVEFTTEKAQQLENGTFEDGWSSTPFTNNSVDWTRYSLEGWGTLNELTTSQGGSYGKTMLGAINDGKGAGYVAMSGTKDTDDASEGSKAALIQTVGWGSENGTGYSSNSILNRVSVPLNCVNANAGELYLGHFDENSMTAVYDGAEISSRPAALRFSYKYLPKNSADWGAAEVQIIAADNSVIAKKSFKITEQNDYTQQELTLEYAAGTKKAARIKVMFKSSDNAECLYTGNDESQLKTYYSYPEKVLNTKDGFIGSKLYVDDIQLIY